jgi:hypothetical protein
MPPLPLPQPPTDPRAYRFRPKTRLDRCAEIAACVLLFWIAGFISIVFIGLVFLLSGEGDGAGGFFAWCGGVLLLVWPAVIALDLRRLRRPFWRRLVAGVVIAVAAVPTTLVAVGIAVSLWRSGRPLS